MLFLKLFIAIIFSDKSVIEVEEEYLSPIENAKSSLEFNLLSLLRVIKSELSN